MNLYLVFTQADCGVFIYSYPIMLYFLKHRHIEGRLTLGIGSSAQLSIQHPWGISRRLYGHLAILSGMGSKLGPFWWYRGLTRWATHHHPGLGRQGGQDTGERTGGGIRCFGCRFVIFRAPANIASLGFPLNVRRNVAQRTSDSNRYRVLAKDPPGATLTCLALKSFYPSQGAHFC